jgi:rod shape determining protein RodA
MAFVTARTISRVDLNLFGAAIIIAMIGCVLVFSATHFSTAPSLQNLYQKQLLWVSIGIVLMLIFMLIDYHVLLDISLILYGVGMLLLLYLLIWGRTTANVKSWIHIAGFQFQPSEFMKIFTAMVLANYFESNDRAYLTPRTFAMVALIIGAPVGLIALQPDFGTAASYFPLVAAAMFFGGIKFRYWLIAIALVAVVVPILWFAQPPVGLMPYQKDRILTFLDPERDPLGRGYQVTQAKIAIGSGGITGKGFTQGTQARLEFLPARHTDFIFAVLGEEWGFVGVVILLAMYMFLVLQSLYIAKTARDRAGTFLVISLISFFIFHIVINISMQIGLLPTTGIPLPLVSYGGSSTMMFFIAVGLILNVDYRKYVNV